MTIEIKVPSLGESISEASISSLIVKSGDIVSMDQEILEIETEKVNQVLYASEAGQITLTVKEGDTVTIGQVIGTIDASKASSEKPKEESKDVAQEQPKQDSPVEEKSTQESSTQEKPQEPVKKEAENPNEPKIFKEIRQSPEAFVEELRSPILKSAPEHTLESIPADAKPREVRKKMSKIRKTIAKRLVDAKQTMALLTTFTEVDMSKVMEIRNKHKDAFLKEHQVKLGFMSFFVSAVVSAMKAFPEINAYIDQDDLVYRNYFDVNVAISLDRGLVTPVIANCDQLSFAQIEKTIVDLATKARDGKLTMDEMRSGGFTISNGGIFGSSFSTPIVNPPQSAILGMHKIVDKPCAVNGEIVIRPVMVLALSYDHRVVDGKGAVSFLAHIAKIIEDPSNLFIN